ncbi:MAG TPA: alpha/beta fold hydrolase [Methylomirabilota bacterium]|nr:alpha/beta fold hydrolase [Methylomirabilota bacterium]
MIHSGRGDRWCYRPRPDPRARCRLLCFAYAGGGASVFRGWERGLPSEVELVAIQLPGRENRLREPPFERMGDLLPALAEAVAPELDRPFFLFGHSMGALIAYELTRWLGVRGRSQPEKLFVSGHRAPYLPNPNPDIHHLPDQELARELRRYNGTPEAVLRNPELMQLLLPVIRADFALLENHRHVPGEPLAVPVSAFGGTEDLLVSRAHLGAWAEVAASGFRLRMLPGDHFFLQSQRVEVLRALAQDIGEALSAPEVGK